MDHAAHEPGTVDECPECRALAYEPGWYRVLRKGRSSEQGPVVIPDANEIHLEVVLPDLERSRLDEDER
jgi:hypothetical protein